MLEITGSKPWKYTLLVFVKLAPVAQVHFFYLQIILLLQFHLQILPVHLFYNHFANFVKQLLFCALIINLSSFSKLDFAAEKSKIFVYDKLLLSKSAGFGRSFELVGKVRFAIAYRV